MIEGVTSCIQAAVVAAVVESQTFSQATSLLNTADRMNHSTTGCKQLARTVSQRNRQGKSYQPDPLEKDENM